MVGSEAGMAGKGALRVKIFFVGGDPVRGDIAQRGG